MRAEQHSKVSPLGEGPSGPPSPQWEDCSHGCPASLGALGKVSQGWGGVPVGLLEVTVPTDARSGWEWVSL